MANDLNDVINTIRIALPDLIGEALAEQVFPQGGETTETGSSVRWSVPQNENNTYTYNTTATEQVAGYRKKDGTYVDRHERKKPPMKVLIDPNIVDLGAVVATAASRLHTKF